MKKRIDFMLLFLVIASVEVFSQSDPGDAGRPLWLGLDVIQSVPSLVLGEKYLIQNAIIVEPSVKIGLENRKAMLLTAGYAKGSSNRHQGLDNISLLTFNGVYFKLGLEKSGNSKFPLTFGYGPILSVTSYGGKFRFEGPVFGDYEGPIPDEIHLAGGIQMYLAINANLNSDLSLRLYHQFSGMARFGELSPLYYPGTGLSSGAGVFMVGMNAGLQLFYRIR